MSDVWIAALGVAAAGAALLGLLHHRLAHELSRLEAAVSELPRPSSGRGRPAR